MPFGGTAAEWRVATMNIRNSSESIRSVARAVLVVCVMASGSAVFNVARTVAADPVGGAVEHHNLGPDKIALQGHDPVGYFTEGKALKGSKELSAQQGGVTYRFASEANRNRFLASPQKYLPAYGGWCAAAMAKGQKVEIDPANFRVADGRLFLFYQSFFGNALKDWLKDEPGQRTRADQHWKRISGE
jgi:YHS domain-containing protein